MTSEEFRTDSLFIRNQFKGEGTFEMPIIKRTKISLDKVALIGYDKVNGKDTDKIVHFFLDDYKFEAVWNDPEPKIDRLKPYRAALSPQFSLYTEMPFAIQIHNVFKSRWCGAFMQSKGLKVIPSLVWGEPDTFWFCFDGIERGSVVAVSTIGMRREKDLFMQGYKEMLKRIEPTKIICYGEPFEEMKGKIISVDYGETNNLKTYYKKTGQPSRAVAVRCETVCLIKGGGAAGGGGASSGFPDFPGWDPKQSPGKGFEWRGRGEVGSKEGSWFNPDTREQLRPDLDHPEPIPPHWDYDNKDGTRGYRIYSDGSYEPKAFNDEGCVLK